MYLIPVEIRNSSIDGKGVFALEPIAVGTVVWRFEAGHDLTMSMKEFENLENKAKSFLEGIGYTSPTTGRWVYPPENDPARFTNHSSSNNLTALVDTSVSEEPYFIANRYIATGEELTNNYHEFDKLTQATNPSWAAN